MVFFLFQKEIATISLHAQVYQLIHVNFSPTKLQVKRTLGSQISLGAGRAGEKAVAVVWVAVTYSLGDPELLGGGASCWPPEPFSPEERIPPHPFPPNLRLTSGVTQSQIPNQQH